MGFSLDLLFEGKWPFYQRLKNGKHVYQYIDGSASWDTIQDKLKCGYENPVLLPIMQLMSFYTSKAKFIVKDKDGKEIENHPLVLRLNAPNIYQSKQDFLAQFIWLKYCIGYMQMYPLHAVAFKRPQDLDAIYNLNAALITWPKGFKTRFVFTDGDVENALDSKFIYDKTGQNIMLSVNDIIPFYDLPNGLNSENMLIAPSRLDGLKKPLTNIARAFDAKNIAIKTNGKELFKNRSSSQVASVPLKQEERDDITEKTEMQYGMATNRSRSIITNADIEWQSLHINLKDLGLDDSVVKDAQMIVSAYNIPKELISFDGKAAKYENQLQATVGFIQGVIQDNVDDICLSLMSYLEMNDGEVLTASFDHLPIMQHAKAQQTKSTKEKIETFKLMIDAGVEPQSALTYLELSELDLKQIDNETD